MRRPKGSFRIPAAMAMLVAWATTAAAVCQVPLTLGANTGNANVLLLLDNSGSMNEALVSSAYNPSTTYTGSFTRTSTYNVASSRNYSPRDFNSRWVATPTAYLVASDVGESGRYSGNYLNWVFFNATPAQRAAIPVVTRIQAAKQVVSSFLANVTDCRLGLEVFEANSNGGVILANMGSSAAAIQTLVGGIHAQTSTPLGESMVSAMSYFQTTGAQAPIQAPCQKSFVVIVTDGLPTSDTNFPATIRDANNDGYYLDDVASYLFRNDMRPDMDEIQNVSTFTIGFNVDAALLQNTATLGGGQYFSIDDADGLEDALTSAFNTIAARVAAGASVPVVASEERLTNRMFRARYESQTWRGFLEAFNVPYRVGDRPAWEAGALLASRSSGSRSIYTSLNGTSMTPFTTTNAATLQPHLGAATLTDARNIINYTRGDTVTGTRQRNGWKLGDIVDAAPIMVGKPSAFNESPGYGAYRSAMAGRREAIYAAANDGMLHCFDATDGTELWGYIPKDLLPKLNALLSPGYCHNYFVNMTPAAYDLNIGNRWRTVVIGGEAQGGNGLFAIDVTSPAPDSVSLLWDVSPASLKGAWTAPTLIRERSYGNPVLVIGSGFDPASAQANLLVMDPANGSILNTLALGTATAENKLTKVISFDADDDGYDDRLYVGDLAGKLWRVDLTRSPWSVTQLFSGTQPIQASPVLTTDELGRAMLFFGTGRFMTATDGTDVTRQTIFGVIDDNSGNTLVRGQLVDQTSVFSPVGSTARGWFVDLTNAGERVTRGAALIAGTLHVSTYALSSAACTGGGRSWLYSIDFRDGSSPDNSNGSENNTTNGRQQSMGDGILSEPTVDLLNERLVLQSSNAVLLTQSITIGPRRLAIRSWRQTW